MKSVFCLFLPALFLSLALHAQTTKSPGKVLVNEKLVSRFIKQTYLLREAAIAQHLKKKTEPVPDWLIPEPGDKMVTYYRPGDTLLFYQSGRTAILYWCSLTNAARFAPSVPFVASTKNALFVGNYLAYGTFTITEAAVNEQYTLKLLFQDRHIRRLTFYFDTSSF